MFMFFTNRCRDMAVKVAYRSHGTQLSGSGVICLPSAWSSVFHRMKPNKSVVLISVSFRTFLKTFNMFNILRPYTSRSALRVSETRSSSCIHADARVLDIFDLVVAFF